MHSGQARLKVLPRSSGLLTRGHELWSEGGHPEVVPYRSRTMQNPNREYDKGPRQSASFVKEPHARQRPWSLAGAANRD